VAAIQRERHLERTTLNQCRQHLELLITPLIGETKLSQPTMTLLRAFEYRLRADRSPAMVRKVIGSLRAILVRRTGTRPGC